MGEDEFSVIAGELYALPAGEFTAARNARAKQLRGKDAALAARVIALRKPSAAANLLNHWALRRPTSLEELFELGRALRSAQDARDAPELTRLAHERRATVGRLSEEVRAVAEELGASASAAQFDEIARTLNAATADENAAGAVASGRLLRPLENVGFGAVDLDGAVAGVTAGGLSVAGQTGNATDAPPRPPVDLAARRLAKEEAKEKTPDAVDAQRAKRDADRERRRAELDERAEETRLALAKAEEAVAALERRHGDLATEMTRLDDRRRAVEQELAAIRRSRRLATVERDRANRDADRAGRAAAQANDRSD